MRRRITEYLDIDLDRETWICNRCDRELGSGHDDYKSGCLVYDRDPRSLYPPTAVSLAPDPAWCRFVEFYCPGCGTMIEVEALPPGHPLTRDIELDIAALKAREGDKGIGRGE